MKMRLQVSKIIIRKAKLHSSNARCLTTTSDPKKAIGLSTSLKEESHSNNVQESFIPAAALPNAGVFSYALRNISKYQNYTAIECGITGRNYTFGQMLDGALRFSSYLQRILLNEKNPTVAVLSPNSPEYLSMFFGCMAMGATVSPINPMYTPEEIANQIIDCNAAVLVVDAMVEPLADGALKLLGKNLPVIVNGESDARPNLQDIMVDPAIPMADPLDVDPKSTAFMPYSSGTTGKPKGVKLSHAAITNNMSMYINPYFSRAIHAEVDHQERYLAILPFFHIYGTMAGLLPGIVYGGKLVTMPMFEPNFFVSTLKKHKLTVLTVVPPLVNFIAMNPLLTKEDLGDLHSFVVGGAPCPLGAAKIIKEKAPLASFQEGYGMTETLLTHITQQKSQKLGFCGHLLPNSQARIIDLETGENLPENTKGELLLKVPSVMTGYHNNEEATKEIIDEEGWLHTGDVAIYTEDGSYSIVDRIKELIKVKGMQVSPSEIEETLLTLPGISDVGVVGVQHARFGEAPLAFVVKSNPSLSEDSIHQHMSQHLAKHKQLIGGIKFVDELPKNQTGKLLRRVLKGMAEK